jgi:hypothetical protein
VPPSLLEKLALEIEDTPTPPKAPKITKRKSILPPPQKLTPLDQLDYRESMSAIFDPDLVIPPERIDQKSKDQEIFPELIPGEGKLQGPLKKVSINEDHPFFNFIVIIFK